MAGKIFCLWLFALSLFSSAVYTQNPIPAENNLAGNPSSEWDVAGSGDATIRGFATDMSVNKGTTVRFKVNITGTNKNFSIKIYRLGYYQGNGARLITTLATVTGVTQPAPLTNASTGLVDCGNWSESASWAVPSTAVSGVYIARLIRQDNGGASHIYFIVRDDAASPDLLFKTSDATWQAYNNYGGSSFYSGSTTYPNGHAVKVSYNRPINTRAGGGGGGPSEDFLFNAEYPLIRWIERNGYYVNYTTDVDMERSTTAITPAKCRVLLSVGHDEYWSAGTRSKFEAARNAGVHLAFFSANSIYWKTRWENSIDASNTPTRTLVCYKEGTLGENVCNTECDPTNIWTGLWRSGCGATATDGCRPENALSGQISWYNVTGAMEIPAEYRKYRLWKNTAVAALADGQKYTMPFGTLGYEWDFEQPQYATFNPAERVTMSRTTIDNRTHKLSMYRHSSGALVFGAGTLQWSWGLDNVHDLGNTAPSTAMQQATVNLFADMGVQPANLQTGLVTQTISTDNTSPVSTIAFPLNGANVSSSATITITGTSQDDGNLSAVELSFDGGVSWELATGTANWSYVWKPTSAGTVTILVRGIDDSYNVEDKGIAPTNNAIAVNVDPPQCPCTIWAPTDIPGVVSANDVKAVELGVKFRSKVNGYIKGVRYYKSLANTGTHIGNLWTSTGTNLARATFTGESSSGWQEVSFSKPVAITAGTTYVASYFAPAGYYSVDEAYFTNAPKSTTTLVALQNGTDGPNGLYLYNATTAFPTASFNSSNYYVDVVFVTSLNAVDSTPPLIATSSPAPGSTDIEINASVGITFNESIDPATVNSNSVQLRNAENILVPCSVSYISASKTVLLVPSAPLSYLTTYTVQVKGGNSLNAIKDTAGNAFARDTAFSFTTRSKPKLPYEGPGGPILVLGSSTNPFSFFYSEILRAEGFNAFATADIAQLSPALLANYDVVVVGEIPLSAANITDLTNWVTAGGTLVAFKPVSGLNALLGLNPSAGTSPEGSYILIDNTTAAGKGIVARTMQFHGTANNYTLNGATRIATLYSSATTATAFPAVTQNAVGANGGTAIAFAFDLAKSVVYTRQGNPLWAAQERDGIAPIRSDDMFYPNWIDFNKVPIPQADEQQHLLANLIHYASANKKPLPRIWFLPRGLKAAVVMTGDDHAGQGASTTSRFNRYRSQSPSNTAEAVANWEAIRATSYVYPGANLSNNDVLIAQQDGFEVGLHLNTNCQNFDGTSWMNFWDAQYATLRGQLPGMLDQKSHRTHCIAWSDFATQAKKQAEVGVHLDVNYYYWPGPWINDRPGLFTGSGMPMRFSDSLGTMIDCYQVTTQLTDESDINIGKHVTALLDSALGTPGYYGVFCANMHTDNTNPASVAGSDIIVNEALARKVPVISAKQLLDWLDGRNASTFQNLVWDSTQLTFTIKAGTGSRNMRAMLPMYFNNKILKQITYAGVVIETTAETIKGIPYVFFDATLGQGSYAARYGTPVSPAITAVTVTVNTNNSATIKWNTDMFSDSKVEYGLTAASLTSSKYSAIPVNAHEITLSSLTPGSLYNFRVSSKESTTPGTVFPAVPEQPLKFIMPAAPCAMDTVAANFAAGTLDTLGYVALEGKGAVMLKPKFNEEFSGTTLSTVNWTPLSYNGISGATSTVLNGLLTVNGMHVASTKTYGPGTVMEFNATFTNAANQNIGLSSNANFSNKPWVMIGQGTTADGNLYIRTSDGKTVKLGSYYIGSTHKYKIVWNTPANTFSFYVDDLFICSPAINLTVASVMYIQISDNNTAAAAVSVDWLRVTPYAATSTFLSRVFDHGVNGTWTKANWAANTPVGTSTALQGRSGNTLVPDNTWSAFTSLTNGANMEMAGRYFQYKAVLSSSSTVVSPSLSQVSISCKDANTALSITQQPTSQSKCVGSVANFVARASSIAPAVIQWQFSKDGSNWKDIAGANKDTLSVIPAVSMEGYSYRAVWTTSNDQLISNTATLSLIKLAGTVSNLSPVKCFGSATGSFTVSVSGGNGPYSYSIDTGKTYLSSGTFSNLKAGNYLVRMKDNSGCSSDTLVGVSEPSPLVFSSTAKTDATCNASATGRITVSAQGGISPYAFSINNGPYQSGGSFTGLTAGTYSVWAKDSNNCTISQSVLILQPALLTTTVLNQKPVNCNGGNDGSFTVEGQGGTGPYQYRIDGGTYQASGFFTGLVAKTYIVTVKDANECTTERNVTITQSALLTSTILSRENATCYGSNTGKITLATTGGTAPYAYSLTGINYQDSASFKDLSAGTYSINTKDAGNCISVTSVTITEPAPLNLSVLSQKAAACKGSASGSVVLGASGGTSTYQYALNNGGLQSSGSFNDLTAGAYTALVKDMNACTATFLFTISEPDSLKAFLSNKKDVDCRGNATGSFTISGSGGTAPYLYSLNNGSYSALNSFSTLLAGTYSVTVIDASGCTFSQSVIVNAPQVLDLAPSALVNVDCKGNNTGLLSLQGIGGTAPYTFSLNEGAYGSGNTFSGLSANTYYVSVKDANACTSSRLFKIAEPEFLGLSISKIVNVDCKGNNSGQVSLAASGGTAPYKFSLNGGAYQSGENFPGLSAGNYTITARDSLGCQSAQLFTITEPDLLRPFVTAMAEPKCAGLNTGLISVSATGGVTPYSYSLGQGGFQSLGSFASLLSGNYLINVKDANGCVQSMSVAVTEPAPIRVLINKEALTCLESSTGSYNVLVSGGVAPLNVSSDGGLTYILNSIQLNGLSAGIYPVKVIDANGCVKDTSVVIDVDKAIWTGKVNSDWHNPGNWSTGRVPSTQTHVIIAGGAPNNCVISNADVAVASIQVRNNAPLEVINDRKIYIAGKCLLLPAD